MASLERRIGGFWNNLGVGIAAIASAFCISASDIYAQTTVEKEAAIKQIYPNASVVGAENLDREQFRAFVENSQRMPASYPAIINDKLEFSTNSVTSKGKKGAGAACRIKGRGANTKYGISFEVKWIPSGTLFHEGSHIISAYLQRNGSPDIEKDFDKLRGTNVTAKVASANRADVPVWPDGYVGPIEGCFTDYGATNTKEDMAETVRVVYMYPDRVKSFLNPANRFYDKRLTDKVDFLKEKGFITAEAYQKVK